MDPTTGSSDASTSETSESEAPEEDEEDDEVWGSVLKFSKKITIFKFSKSKQKKETQPKNKTASFLSALSILLNDLVTLYC